MIALACYIAALVLALIDEFQAKGTHLLGWAVILVCIGLLAGHLG